MTTGFQTHVQQKYFSEAYKGFINTEPYGTGPPKSGIITDPTQLSWLEKCGYYDAMFMQQPLAKAQVLTIAAQVTGSDLFLNPVLDIDGKAYPRSLEARNFCDKFNKRVGIKTLIWSTAFGMAIYGATFWEKDLANRDIRLIPDQATIYPYAQDSHGNITKWAQGRQQPNRENPVWNAEDIVEFPWNQMASTWPYGTSLLVGLETEFQTRRDLFRYLSAFVKHNAFPKEIYQIGDGQYMPGPTEMDSIRSAFRVWEPGQFHVTNYPTNKVSGGVGEREIADLAPIFNVLKDDLVDGLMTNPVSALRSSTHASGRMLFLQQRANIIVPMQQVIADVIMQQVYEPLLELNGFSRLTCPELVFSDPESHKVDQADYYSKLITAKCMSPLTAARELGCLDELLDWIKQHPDWINEGGGRSPNPNDVKGNNLRTQQRTNEYPEDQKVMQN